MNPWWEIAIRVFSAENGPSGPAWNISSVLDCLRKAQGMARDSAETEGLRGLSPAKPDPKDAP